MRETAANKRHLEQNLQPIRELLGRRELLERLSVTPDSSRKELVSDLVARQTLADLANKLDKLHNADIAGLLETLPLDDRHFVWRQLADERAGDVLWQVADGVAETLISETSHERLKAICLPLEVGDLLQLADLLPGDVLDAVLGTRDPGERSWLRASITYPEDTVGSLMSPDVLVAPATATFKTILKMLRKAGNFPDQTDKLFIVDERHRLLGELLLTRLLLHRPRNPISEAVSTDAIAFEPGESIASAAQAFERYDLVSAPVVDERGRLIGRLTVDDVMDYVREEAEEDAFLREGLHADEDLFGPVWTSARRRWLWLGLNLATALVASRVIGLFEGSIEKLVALATLMPIVASIGGNTGNQTVALIVRGLATGMFGAGNVRYLALKEIGIAAINGTMWGSVMGMITFLLYGDTGLAAVMGVATLLNLVVAAMVGTGVPLLLNRLGRDPAYGSSVLLTFTTDSMGFLIFLGLATVFLLG